MRVGPALFDPGVPINDLIMNTLRCLFYVSLYEKKKITSIENSVVLFNVPSVKSR